MEKLRLRLESGGWTSGIVRSVEGPSRMFTVSSVVPSSRHVVPSTGATSSSKRGSLFSSNSAKTKSRMPQRNSCSFCLLELPAWEVRRASFLCNTGARVKLDNKPSASSPYPSSSLDRWSLLPVRCSCPPSSWCCRQKSNGGRDVGESRAIDGKRSPELLALTIENASRLWNEVSPSLQGGCKAPGEVEPLFSLNLIAFVDILATTVPLLGPIQLDGSWGAWGSTQ